jgi:PiT family inorganic phosphate transporter
VGAVVSALGVHSLNWKGLEKIFTALFTSPILGFVAGYGIMWLLMGLFRNHAPGKLNRHFRRLQVVSAGFMALTHGGNDAQKTMGIITLALVGFGHVESGTFVVPLWVKLACALVMGLGTAMGGWRIIKTVGKKIMGLQPIHGFGAETSAAVVIAVATHFGQPVSTTHVISSSIMGVGSAKRLTAVRWGIVRTIFFGWVLTLPASALFAAVTLRLLPRG